MDGKVGEEIPSWSMGLGRIGFVAGLLVSLDQLQLTERAIAANAPWLLKILIAAPWVFCTLFATALWIVPKRSRTISQGEAYRTMTLMWVMLIPTYQAFDKLAIHWH